MQGEELQLDDDLSRLASRASEDLERAEGQYVRMTRVWNYVVIGGATGGLAAILLLVAWGLTGGILFVGWGAVVVGASQIGCVIGWLYATAEAPYKIQPGVLGMPLSTGEGEEWETSSRVRGP
jgi:hypothetical protein